MKRAIERNVDSEMAMELQEDQPLYKAPPVGESFTAQSWAKKFYKDSDGQPAAKEQSVNPFGNISDQPASETKKKESKGLTDWISENPGTALIAALLIGGGAYLIGSYLKGKYFEDTTKPSSRRRRTKINAEKEDTQDSPGLSISKEEVVIGAVAAAGGAVLGAVLKDTSVAAAIPMGAIGAVSGKVPLIAVALGLVLGGQLRKLFQSNFGSDAAEKKAERETDLRAKGYVETMLGTFKL